MHLWYVYGNTWTSDTFMEIHGLVICGTYANTGMLDKFYSKYRD